MVSFSVNLYVPKMYGLDKTNVVLQTLLVQNDNLSSLIQLILLVHSYTL